MEVLINKPGSYTLKLQFNIQNWKEDGGGPGGSTDRNWESSGTSY